MLEIQNLHVKFHNRDREAVSGVSLTIQDGEILGLVGESGSGKSVTAMSVAGLLPRKQCDYTGRILLDGQELLHADRSVLREIQGAEIGVVFQEPQSCMDPLMKIGSQVEETLRIHTQMPKEERHQRALAAMAAAELPDPEGICDKYPHELSGGMLQRAMIAAAIVNRPKLLLLDEYGPEHVPFSAERLPVAPFDRVTEPSSVKILRESRSELLKPLLFIADFCCRNKKKGLNMKVITMESSAFRSLTEQIAEIAAHVRAASGDKKAASPDRLLTTREAAHLLNVSTRTLQRMRSEQRIGYVVLRGKCRYRQSEIDRLLEACAVNEDAATPQELKRNHTLRTGGKPKGRRT